MVEDAKRPMADGMEGWVIVPAKDTNAMWMAGNSELENGWGPSSVYHVMLAAAPAHPASEAVARLVEALKEIRFLWAGHSEQCEIVLRKGNRRCDCDWPKVRDKCDAALAPFLPKESNNG